MNYLGSDLDEEDERDEDEQVVEYAECSDDDVDDLEHAITYVGQIGRRQRVVRRRRDVVPDNTRQRCVLHRRNSELRKLVQRL